MPVKTVVRPQFAAAVRDALGGMRPAEASRLTEISDVYIYKMLAGRVPSEDIIHRFAEGLKKDETTLRVAAGYEQPEDLRQYLSVCLDGRLDLKSDDRKEMMNALEPVIKRIESNR
jgi:hypothetical protein